MSVDLPAHLGAGPVAHESCAASVGRNQKKARHSIHAVIYVFAPLNDEICRDRDAMRQLRLNPWMHVDEVDRTGARIRQDAEIVSDRVDRIECSECVAVRIVATRNIGLYVESGPKGHAGQAVTSIGCERPRPNIIGAKCSELHHALIIEVGPGLLGCDRPPQPGAGGVPKLSRGTAIKGRVLSIESQVVKIVANAAT